MPLVLVYTCWVLTGIFFPPSCRYASRVRCIINDTSKHVAPKEIMRLKKLIAYWKEQAGKRSEDDDLEEIQEERTPKEKADNRLTSWEQGTIRILCPWLHPCTVCRGDWCWWSFSTRRRRRVHQSPANRTFRYDLTMLYTNCIVTDYIMAMMPLVQREP